MSAPATDVSSRRALLLGGTTVGLAVVLSAYAVSFPLNHDVGWYLHLAGAVLEGGTLYGSLIEINPPLFTWLSTGPVLLAEATGLPIEPLFEGVVLMLAFGSAAWAIRLTAGRSPWPPFALGTGLLVALLAVPGIDFGQREHLMFLLTAPYLALTARRLEGRDVGRGTAIAAGLTAGLGFSLKPHYALLWLAVEALWVARAWRRRDRPAVRPEAVGVVAVAALYIAVVALVHTEYFALLWTAGALYESFGDYDRTRLLNRWQVLALAAGVALAWRGGGRLVELGRIYLVFAAAALGLVVLQGKGWSYHYYPVLGALVVLTFALGGHVADRVRRRRAGVPLQLAAGIALVLSTGFLLARNFDYDVPERQRRLETLSEGTAFFAGRPAARSMLMLTDVVADAFPLVNRADLEWTSPFATLWWLQAVYEGGPISADRLKRPESMEPVERRFSERLIESFAERRPDYVLVDTAGRAHYGGEPFPYLEYFGQWDVFEAEWRHYTREGSLGRFAVWRRSLGAGRVSMTN